MHRLAADLVPHKRKEYLSLRLGVPAAARQKRQPVGINGRHRVGELPFANLLQVRVFGPLAPWDLRDLFS